MAKESAQKGDLYFSQLNSHRITLTVVHYPQKYKPLHGFIGCFLSL